MCTVTKFLKSMSEMAEKMTSIACIISDFSLFVLPFSAIEFQQFMKQNTGQLV